MHTEHNRTRRLLLDAQELGDGWLMATDYQDMKGSLRALFWSDSFDDLMAARIPMFLGQKMTGQDGKRMTTDEAEDAGLLLSEGDAVPPIRRLRGIRLDVLKELAEWCRATDLIRMIEGDFIDHAVETSPLPAPVPKDPRKKVSDDEIRMAWDTTGGVIAKIAQRVGIERSAVRKRLAKLDLIEANPAPKAKESKSLESCWRTALS